MDRLSLERRERVLREETIEVQASDYRKFFRIVVRFSEYLLVSYGTPARKHGLLINYDK